MCIGVFESFVVSDADKVLSRFEKFFGDPHGACVPSPAAWKEAFFQFEIKKKKFYPLPSRAHAGETDPSRV